jgi:hypothetical protein
MDNQKEPKPKFTQLLGGMMLKTMQPFVMFISGTRLQKMWDFGKEIKPYTKTIPMFAFNVKLALETTKTAYGTNHVVTFNIQRDGKGLPVLVTDKEMANMLRSGVESVQAMFDSFIEQKEVDRHTGELKKDSDSARQELVGEAVKDLSEPPADYQPSDSYDVSDSVPF